MSPRESSAASTRSTWNSSIPITRQAVDNGATAEKFYRYRTAVIESRRRQEETKALIEIARVFLVGLSLN
jgi:hypothetical protein